MKDLRRNYTQGELDDTTIASNPIVQFSKWFEEAMAAKLKEPNAMILSTVYNNAPDSRIVLLKGIKDDSFIFYTNYESNKAQQLSVNPMCSLVFPWIDIERQVIVRGSATKISEKESDDYFYSRPRSSQIGAWASQQSRPIDSRELLENQLNSMIKKFENKQVQRPSHWGGFVVIPDHVEFWQGRPNRLHDRLLFTRNDQNWNLHRLQP